ncbi:MAG TPA: type II secretion system protein [Rhodocyclaceae bacterium]|nr:type II secretion system protein [Rhodocyclaceae bacterium]HNH35084.1 type II secretion system protein [Rhodocyclaceae bacterium]
MAAVPRLPVRPQGFTTLELVVVIAVIGILAVAILPRFVDDLSFKTRGYYDQVFAAVEYARQQAMAHRRVVCVQVAGSPAHVRVFTSNASPTDHASCTVALTDPKTGAAFDLAAPSGVAVSPNPGTISFDWYGRPAAAAAWTVSGDGSYSLTVEAETGHVH